MLNSEILTAILTIITCAAPIKDKAKRSHSIRPTSFFTPFLTSKHGFSATWVDDGEAQQQDISEPYTKLKKSQAT
jgi:hypothetical protein